MYLSDLSFKINFFEEIFFVILLVVFDTNEIDEATFVEKSLHYCMIDHSFYECKLCY